MASSSSAGPGDSGDYFVSKPTEFIHINPSTFEDMVSFVKDLHDSDEFSDLTIHCRGETFSAHKLILASRSMYFKDKLRSDQQMSEITLDMNPDILRLCLSYIYTGTAEVIDHCAEAVADLSKLLGLNDLHRDCARHTINKLLVNSSNCLQIYSTAHDINDDELIKKSLPIVLSSFSKWRPSSNFKQLPLSCALKILSHPELKVASPNQRLTSALSWLKADPSSRIHHLVSLIEHLPLREMDQWFVRQIIEDEEILQGQQKACSLLNDTVAHCKHSLSSSHHKSGPSVSHQQTRHCGVIVGMRRFFNGSYQDAENHVYAVTSITGGDIKSITTIPSRFDKFGRVACCMNGGVLYVSGAGDDQREVYSFDMMKDKWCELSKLLTRRECHCMCVSGGGSLYVLGGCVPGIGNLVSSIEKLVDESREWRESGHLNGTGCYNTVCCALNLTDILVCGVWDEGCRITFQVFDTRDQTVTHILKPTIGLCWVYGVVVADDHVIMLGQDNTYTVPVSSVYKSNSRDVHTASSYITPNTRCAVFLSEDNHHIMLVGGGSRNTKLPHYAFRASVKEIIQHHKTGWQRVTMGGDLGSSLITSGAVCSGQIPLTLME